MWNMSQSEERQACVVEQLYPEITNGSCCRHCACALVKLAGVCVAWIIHALVSLASDIRVLEAR